MTHRTLLLAAGLALLPGATARLSAQQLDGPPAGLRAAAAAHFDAYSRAIATPTPETIASFYAPTGTVIRILNGNRIPTTRAALDSTYRQRWRPPAFFQFDSLSFDSLAPGQVLVSGRFRWQATGRPDTLRYLYSALLETVDSGMTIRVELETAAPAPH